MSDTLSIFDAAREAPNACAVVDGATELTFAEVAQRTAPRAAALLAARPPALALSPRATTESLLWLYAAFAVAAILWKVELATSYSSTRGVPSTSFERIFVTST